MVITFDLYTKVKLGLNLSLICFTGFGFKTTETLTSPPRVHVGDAASEHQR